MTEIFKDAPSYEHVVIDRAKWDIPGNRAIKLPGRNILGGSLYNAGTGLQCCLGFLGTACGLTFAQMDTLGEPDDIQVPTGEVDEYGEPETQRSPAWPKGLKTQLEPPKIEKLKLPSPHINSFNTTSLENILMCINDSPELDNPTRERLITEYGEKAGIKFKFVGSYLGAPTEEVTR